MEARGLNIPLDGDGVRGRAARRGHPTQTNQNGNRCKVVPVPTYLHGDDEVAVVGLQLGSARGTAPTGSGFLGRGRLLCQKGCKLRIFFRAKVC